MTMTMITALQKIPSQNGCELFSATHCLQMSNSAAQIVHILPAKFQAVSTLMTSSQQKFKEWIAYVTVLKIRQHVCFAFGPMKVYQNSCRVPRPIGFPIEGVRQKRWPMCIAVKGSQGTLITRTNWPSDITALHNKIQKRRVCFSHRPDVPQHDSSIGGHLFHFTLCRHCKKHWKPFLPWLREYVFLKR